MDADLNGLVRSVSKLRGGNGRRYPPSLRAQIAGVASVLRARGASWHRVAEQIGIPLETIRGFCGVGAKATRAFVPVEVTEPPIIGSGIVVVCPGGYRVEGLGLEEAAEFVRRLR